MHTRAIIAALFAMLINASVFAAGAAAMLASSAGNGSLAAYLLPAVMAVSLFVSPLIGWMIAPSLQWGRMVVADRR